MLATATQVAGLADHDGLAYRTPPRTTYPVAFFNPTNAVRYPGGTMTLQPGQLALHPGPAGGFDAFIAPSISLGASVTYFRTSMSVAGGDFAGVRINRSMSSYTRFFYSTQRSDPNDTGAMGHRVSNLVGHSDSNATEDSGKLNVTWHHNWWGQYVMERQPRVRFGKNHVFNTVGRISAGQRAAAPRYARRSLPRTRRVSATRSPTPMT